MQSLARNGYTSDQIKTALHSSNRTLAFRYELLDNVNKFKRHLGNVLGASVVNNSLADIKRTARFSMRDDQMINFLSDRIKPYARLKMSDGGWVEFPQGVFLLTTPPRKTNSIGIVTREVEAYDQTQILIDDKVEDRYTISAGTNYINGVKDVLISAGITSYNLTTTSKTLPADRDWEPGTTKLRIINDLLGSINYETISFDEDGQAIAKPYISPSIRASEYTYKDDDKSVLFPEVEQSLDLWEIPNKWVLVVSEPDMVPLIATYTNENPNSPTSTVSRGRIIVDYREQEEAADQETLNAKAERLAFNASQVYEHIPFDTAIMPMHSNADVLKLEFSGLGISAKYVETSWGFELKAGARMKHSIRRVVNV